MIEFLLDLSFDMVAQHPAKNIIAIQFRYNNHRYAIEIRPQRLTFYILGKGFYTPNRVNFRFKHWEKKTDDLSEWLRMNCREIFWYCNLDCYLHTDFLMKFYWEENK
jgi:hypothetical protein